MNYNEIEIWIHPRALIPGKRRILMELLAGRKAPADDFTFFFKGELDLVDHVRKKRLRRHEGGTIAVRGPFGVGWFGRRGEGPRDALPRPVRHLGGNELLIGRDQADKDGESTAPTIIGAGSRIRVFPLLAKGPRHPDRSIRRLGRDPVLEAL